MAIKPASLDLTIYRGTDFSAIITFQDTNEAAIDITGYDFIAQVRKAPTFSVVAIDLNPTIYNAAAGEVKMELTHAQTIQLTASDQYYWDLLVEDPTGLRTGPYVAGRFMIKEPVSKF